MVALQGLADVLGVAVSHAVHVEVAQAAGQHHQDLRQDIVGGETLHLFFVF